MEATSEGLCNTLYDEGVRAATAGDKTTAIARFDDVIARCAPASEPWMVVKTAGALFNKATCYRFAAATDQAVAVFDDIVARFGTMPDLTFRRYVCMALYNKGVALQDARRLAAAIAAYEAAISHCRQDEDSAVRERVARSIAAKVACIAASQTSANVVVDLRDLITLFEKAPEPAIQAIVGNALVTYPRLLSLLRPAGHAATLPANLEQAREMERIKREDPAHADTADEYLKRLREMVAKDLAAAFESHVNALQVLEAYWRDHKPFALFLRSFDLEASQVQLTPTQADYVPVRSINMQYTKVEETVAEILDDRLSAVGIWNPQAIEAPDIQRRIPKLEIRDAYWEYVLRALLKLASLIVMHMDTLTPGVETELNAIRKEGKDGVSIIILPDPTGEDEHALGDYVAAVYNQEYQASVVKRPAVDINRLAGFAVVVEENDLDSPETQSLIDKLIAKVAPGNAAETSSPQ